MSLLLHVLKSKLTVFGVLTFLLAVIGSVAATSRAPQMRINGAEVDCNVPAQLVLHGDFGKSLGTITLVLHLPAGPTGLWIIDESPSRITAELQGCSTPGTYRLTVGYGVDSDIVANLRRKVRPPQFYTVLDVTLGAVGAQGPQGEQGPPGPAGMDGVDGVDGAPGSDGSRWLTGALPPDDAMGQDGDLYLQQGDPGLGDVFEKVADEWVPIGNIRGEQGLQGGQGIQGIRGPMGPPGTDGSEGPAGADGLACWDLNENSTCDALDQTDPLNEDLNGDTVCSPADCMGPQGPVGPQGPAGADGAAGLPGNLVLAGMACPPDAFVTGFDSSGNLLCATGTSTSICANNVVELGEQCDDGNVVDGDGCSSTCQLEPQVCAGMPGQPPPPDELVITEVMYAPQGKRIADAEWFEVHWAGDGASSGQLCGMTVSNGASSFTIQSDLSIGEGDFLVFGHSADLTLNGNIPVDYVYPSGFRLDLAGQLSLTLPTGPSDFVDYSALSGWPLALAASMQFPTLDALAHDNNVGPNWCVSTVAENGALDRSSPGLPSHHDCALGVYPFNEASGNAQNLGTTGVDGTPEGGIPRSSVGGAPTAYGGGGFISPDGNGDRINLGSWRLDQPSLSLSIWFRAPDYNVDDVLLERGDGSFTAWRLMLRTGNLEFTVTKNPDVPVQHTASAPVGPADAAWHHVVAIADEAELRLYVDGVLLQTQPAAGPVYEGDTTTTIYVGDSAGGNKRFAGDLDELLIFARPLSDAERAAVVARINPAP